MNNSINGGIERELLRELDDLKKRYELN